MTITEPTSDAYEVTAPIELSDRVQALLLDHFLDHLHVLTLVSAAGRVPDHFTYQCLSLHHRYRPFLDETAESGERLIQRLQFDTAALFNAYTRILRLPPEERDPFYRAVLKTVPFLGHDDRLRLQFDPPPSRPPTLPPSASLPTTGPVWNRRTCFMRLKTSTPPSTPPQTKR